MASVTFSGLDPFRLSGIMLTQNELGTGSYATVYELDYYGLKCAGKKIHDLLVKQAGSATYQLSRFAEECRLLSQVRHPNIVQFLGIYYEQGMQVPMLVMEFLPLNLTSCIEKNGVLCSELSYSILHDVALGLNYLHSQEPPIIHRDLSSNNVLLTPDMKAKISDLGVAKIVNLTPLQVSRMAHNTQAPGTPAYMPPEALVAKPKYDKSIDIFSFGVMIIHMFSGKWPEPQEAPIRMDPVSDRMIPVSEAERREVFLTSIGDKHPIMTLIHQCITNNPKKRPNISEIVPQLKEMVSMNPPSFSNRLEMLQHINERKSSEEELSEKLQSQIKTLQQELKAAITKKQDVEIQPTSEQSMDNVETTEEKMSSYRDYYLLMKNTTTTTVLFRGELLRSISRDEAQRQSKLIKVQHHNFCVEWNPAVTLFATEDNVSPLANDDYNLLTAIKSHPDRFRVFADPNWLDWGAYLKIGSEVYVHLPSRSALPSTWSSAVVRYKGAIKSLPGTIFGVEISDPNHCGKGTSDGVFQGHRYFTCKNSCGLFVSLDKLWFESPDTQKEPQSQQSSTVVSSSYTDPPRSQFRINDRVVIFDSTNTPLHGFIRWTGRKNHIGRDMGEMHVGIEMIISVNPTDIPGAKTGLSSLFAAKSKHSIIIPESMVVSVERHTLEREKACKDKSDQQEVDPPENPPAVVPTPLDISHRGNMKRQHSLQPHAVDYRHHIGAQRSSSISQGEGVSESFSSEYRRLHGVHQPHPSQIKERVEAQNTNLTIGSRIQIPSIRRAKHYEYGVIRWIGAVSAIRGLVAGIELDEYMEGCTDGTLLSTGQKFFQCIPGRGIYYPLANLQPDARFMDPAFIVGADNIENPLCDVPYTVDEDQFTEGCHEQIQRYIGERKGIQGHQNSCYLDTSIFGLFALTDAFDELFLRAKSSKTADQNRRDIADLLWKGIVNPLRKNGIVRYESVMALRTKLDEFGEMEGIAHAEKDPEEFLNMLFKHTLKVDPFLTIRRPYGDEPEFFVQIFVEYDESVKLPSIGFLLHTMFKEQKLSFLQMPSRLLIQVPRFGRQFKTYDHFIPDLKLNITDLTDEYIKATPRCFLCDTKAEVLCKECAAEGNKDGYLCSACSGEFHFHPSRKYHALDQNIAIGYKMEDQSPLDLISVICIETSHYVCFTKEPSEGRSRPKWIFLDSMANRINDRFNIPSVTECSDFLNEWVYPANGDLSKLRNTAPQDLPEYVRRFTQDVYLCVYVNTNAIWYGY